MKLIPIKFDGRFLAADFIRWECTDTGAIRYSNVLDVFKIDQIVSLMVEEWYFEEEYFGL